MEKVDYGKTLNLPKTKFPMRGNLPNKEPEWIEKWEEEDIYKKIQEKNKGNEKFILHDGPPYANGDIHLGHSLNKILKDIIIKYKSQRGFDSPYVPGWDTHGLPIELQAIKDLNINRHEMDKVEFRKYCAKYAMKYVEIQKEEFKRLGVRGDWDHPYITLSPELEAEQINVFGEMAQKGYIYKGLKPVYWCPQCETALAEAEIEYKDVQSPAIYVKFPIVDSLDKFDVENAYAVIWTTTPWTLPANLAIAINENYEYQLIKLEEEYYLMAKELIPRVLKEIGFEGDYEVVKEFIGSELEGLVCRHPFIDRDSKFILGDHVTLEAGTGCVHTAPGHGTDDYIVGKKYDLDVLSPVDGRGIFTKEAGKYEGEHYSKANKKIVEDLKEMGALLHFSKIDHSYPHCWRCKSQIIYRSTEQWFASIDGFRKKALEAIDGVKFIPSWGHDRIYNMVADRGDWCISRQRTWGVPIPIFYCKDCNQEIINEDTIKHVSELFREHGSDIWFMKEADELVPEGLVCPDCGHNHFEKETDIMDVWFDSGSTHRSVLEARPELSFPADLYLEGSDQHRGWFNSSLCTAVATRGVSPYKQLLTHGFLVDEKGIKMSKSLGNGIEPQDIIKQMGADILRLWVSSADYRSDIAISQNILKQTSEAYRKIRNTFRYILGNLSDFSYEQDKISYDELTELDKYALLKLTRLIEKVTKAYDNYDFHVVYHAIHNFCAVDMSAFYLDIVKDRLYILKEDSKNRRAAQTVLYEIGLALVKMITPVLAFTSEEIWSHFPKNDKEESVQLEEWPEINEIYLNDKLEEKWDKIVEIRDIVAKPLEDARRNKKIGHSLDAVVHLYGEDKILDLLANLDNSLDSLFIASEVVLHPEETMPENAFIDENLEGLGIVVEKSSGEKCDRCWKYKHDITENDEYPGVCQSCLDILK